MSASRWPDPEAAIAAAFDAFPVDSRRGALVLRQLIFDVAADVPGPLEEALRWGQPAYLTPKGSTLRLGVPKAGGFALYAHCQSRVIPEFRALFPTEYRYEGNRAVLFNDPDEIRPNLLSGLVRHALTYHAKPT